MAKDVKEITEKLEAGVKAIFASPEYKEYLEFMGKFYNYSANNCMLIWMQKPDASLVAGYKSWLTKFNRQVRKGENGITILDPIPHKFTKEVINQDGDPEEVEVNYTSFRAVSVFDISQTDGEAIPTNPYGCNEMTGTVEEYGEIMQKLRAVSPVRIDFEEIEGGALGYFNHADNRIAIKEGMSQVQTVKTTIHEVAHAILHNKQNGAEKDADRNTKEVEAESVAYTVCSMLGLDVSEYSFGYVAGWSTGKDAKELTISMEVIRKTAKEMIDSLRAA